MIELRDIGKYFSSNGVVALENANFTLKPGEIHALLGENGSGKSTLMHILAGYFPPTSGTIFVEGEKRRFETPRDALNLRIGMVRQHPGFIRGMKVWENCILGSEGQGWLFFDSARLRNRVEETAAHWRFDLPLGTDAQSLTVSQRQKAAILALLLKDVKWFIFDEPTAALSQEECKSIFELYKHLRSEGRGIIFITHKLHEAEAISDRITVIKAGVTDDNSSIIFTQRHIEPSVRDTKKNILQGKPMLNLSAFVPPCDDYDKILSNGNLNSSRLVIKDLSIEAKGMAALKNVNLHLLSGSILGITGDRNSGLETFESALVGILPFPNKGALPGRWAGTITLNGQDIAGKGTKAFRNAGGAYLGADRLENNLALNLPLFESLIIHAFRRLRFGIFLNMGGLYSWCRAIMNRAGITRPVTDRVSSFSGGMLQRILLAREFAEEASLLVLSEAGSGLDQLSRRKLASELEEYVSKGASALLFSTDAEELLPFTSEILDLRNGDKNEA